MAMICRTCKYGHIHALPSGGGKCDYCGARMSESAYNFWKSYAVFGSKPDTPKADAAKTKEGHDAPSNPDSV